MIRSWIGCVLAAGLLSASAASARDLGEILEKKGVITPDEAKEAAKSEEHAAGAAPAVPALPEWVSKITLFGDVRLRNEVFFRDGDRDRNRDRFRLRFGAKAKVNEETELGFKLVSGTANDPISNNVTASDQFTFKNINIGNAYLKLAPAASIGLDRPIVTLMGGKFDVPLYRIPGPSQPVFDGDLTPEGFFESVKPIEAKDGFLRGLSFNLGQWIFQENANTGDGAVFAFQGLASMALGDAEWNLAVGDYKFQKASTIASARNRNTSLNVTNTVVLSDGTVVGGRPIDPTKFGPNKDGISAPTVDAEGNVVPGKAITIVGYVSDFNEMDVGTDLLVPTGAPSWPVRAFFEYVKNTEAEGGDDQGFQGGATLGASKDPGNLWLTYAYERLETDAVISAFSESDFGHDGGTNTKAHIVQAGYVLWKNLSILSTVYFDKPIREVSGRNANLDTRWQVDVIAKF